MTDFKSECYVPQTDGSLIKISAWASKSRDSRPELAPLKILNTPNELARHCKEVLAAARLTETELDPRWLVELQFDPLPQTGNMAWELAAVLVDRIARQTLAPPAGNLYALGYSAAWETGRLAPLPNDEQQQCLGALGAKLQAQDRLYLSAPQASALLTDAAAGLLASGVDLHTLSHLGSLSGQPDPGSQVQSAKVWFPLVSGQAALDCLAWVEVSVLPVAPGQQHEANLVCTGSHPPKRLSTLTEVITQSRGFDNFVQEDWRTVIRFSRSQFVDDSYQLALVMADRIARGFDVPAKGRLIATGCSACWREGRIDSVAGETQKCQLFLRDAVKYDRILVPTNWESEALQQVRQVLRAREVSLVALRQLI